MTIVKLSTLKKEDYFRNVGGKTVFVYGDKVRNDGKRTYSFCWYKFNDVNDYGYCLKDKDVEIDFDF